MEAVMRLRHPVVPTASMCLAFALAIWSLMAPNAIARAQQSTPAQTGGITSGSPAQPPQTGRTHDSGNDDSAPVIKSEVRVVLVDSVVTDKKGNYIRDLTAKEFRVWEDGKEQTIKSFSSESDPASGPNSQKHYLVLMFDNSTMDFGDQARAREAAAKFIDSNG